MEKDTQSLELGDITDANISAVRSEVIEWQHNWRMNRAFRAGSQEVRKLQEGVLPKIDEEQSKESYAVYLEQAILYQAAQETADAWGGLIYKKDPVYSINGTQASELYADYLNSITDDGMSATELLREITDEVITVNRFGILLDYPVLSLEDAQISRAEQLEQKVFSNALQYKAESIVNWFVQTINHKKQLTILVLKERLDNFNMQSYSTQGTFQYRVLTMESSELTASGYAYRQRVFKDITESSDAKKHQFELILDVTPLNDGIPMEQIPFWLFNRAGQESLGTVKPSLLDGITEINKGHFRNSADYENEIHRTSIKTPVIPGGLAEDSKNLSMGGVLETAFVEAKPYILESTSPSPLAEEMASKEKRMAYLGARVLGTSDSRITAETARIQAASEESILGDMANIISDDFSDMLKFKMQWDFGEDIFEVSTELNTDFWENEINIPDLISAFGWLQSGGGSLETYYNLLNKRNVYSKNWSLEQEKVKILETQKWLQSNEVGAIGTGEVINTGNVILNNDSGELV